MYLDEARKHIHRDFYFNLEATMAISNPVQS